jgi:uncharacterized protein YqjF (DUF2071 family)
VVVPVKDFPYAILKEVAHRPYPLPDRPWVMTQSWHDLLFAHWPIDAALMQSKLPASVELDRWDGHAWLGVVPFRMTNVAPRGLPALPWISVFPELNVRTYVSVDGRPGVYFFSLDAGNPLAVVTARTLFNLPYFSAWINFVERDGWITYVSGRTSEEAPPATWNARYRPTGSVLAPEPGSLDYFLTERYCLYTIDRSNRPARVDIHHPPWPLQGAEADIAVNTMADAAGIRLPQAAPLLHFAKRQDVVTWLPIDARLGDS